jgi:truncated hemoglobin YjbI
MTNKPIPTLLDWCGGLTNIQRLTTRFYERVPQDPVLAPVFAGMDPHHAEHALRSSRKSSEMKSLIPSWADRMPA